MRRMAAIATVAVTVLSGCGSADEQVAKPASDEAIATFFDSVTGQLHASYLGYPTFAKAASAAELVVVAKLKQVAPGPTLGEAELSSQGGSGVKTVMVSAKVERVLKGDAPGKSVEFLVVSDGADAALATPITPVSETNVMLLLYKRDDGRLEFAGPQGVLMESDGAVTAPLAGDDGYGSDVEKYETLADAAETVTQGSPSARGPTP